MFLYYDKRKARANLRNCMRKRKGGQVGKARRDSETEANRENGSLQTPMFESLFPWKIDRASCMALLRKPAVDGRLMNGTLWPSLISAGSSMTRLQIPSPLNATCHESHAGITWMPGMQVPWGLAARLEWNPTPDFSV